jgi:excisionase family DNA binding protein
MDSTPVTNNSALLEDTVVADGLLSIDQARQILGGVSRSYLYNLLRDGALPSVWFGKKLRMVPKRALIAFANKLVSS